MDHLTETLLQLFAILLAAKVGNEIFRRLGQPTIVGEILGGLVVGPAVLGIYEISTETQLFAEIGVDYCSSKSGWRPACMSCSGSAPLRSPSVCSACFCRSRQGSPPLN